MNPRNKLWMAGTAIALFASGPALADGTPAPGTMATTHDAASDAMHQAMMDKAGMPMNGASLPDGTMPGAAAMQHPMGPTGESAVAQQAAQQHAMRHGMSDTDPTRAAAANAMATDNGMMTGHGNMGPSGTDAAGMMQTANKHGGMGGMMGGSGGSGGMMGGASTTSGTGTPGMTGGTTSTSPTSGMMAGTSSPATSSATGGQK